MVLSCFSSFNYKAIPIRSAPGRSEWKRVPSGGPHRHLGRASGCPTQAARLLPDAAHLSEPGSVGGVVGCGFNKKWDPTTGPWDQLGRELLPWLPWRPLRLLSRCLQPCGFRSVTVSTTAKAGEGRGGPRGRGAGLRPQQFVSVLKPVTQESCRAGAFGGCGGSEDDRFPEF